MAKPSAAKTASTLPAALAKRATAAHAQRLARLARAGRDAITKIRDARAQIAGTYFDVGEALVVLSQDGMAEALGRADFAEVCALDLDMAAATARQLLTLATRLDRATVELLGRERALALLALADATPADDTVTDLLAATLVLPSKRRLAVRDASTAEIEAAAKEFRDARGATTGRRSAGFTTTPQERATFAKSARGWSRADLAAQVKTTLRASRKGFGAMVTVELPLTLWTQLAPPPRRRGQR